jgi:hypothetical protein
VTDPSCHEERDSGDDQLDRFCGFVLNTIELHDDLRAMADIDDFIALVIRMGQERGFCFAADDVWTAMRTTSRVFNARSTIS